MLLQDINAAGVARMTRMLSVLQPALSTLGTTGGNFRPEVLHHSARVAFVPGLESLCARSYACFKYCTAQKCSSTSCAEHILFYHRHPFEQLCGVRVLCHEAWEFSAFPA
jgi:hypothetical protein